jgi:hypothetical protein
MLQYFSAGCAIWSLPTVFPSLRAHEPNPAERAVHRDPAGFRILRDLCTGVSCLSRRRNGERRDKATNEPQHPLRCRKYLKYCLLRSGPFRLAARGGALQSCLRAKLAGAIQFTNRRILTFITTPSAKNVNSTEDPP